MANASPPTRRHRAERSPRPWIRPTLIVLASTALIAAAAVGDHLLSQDATTPRAPVTRPLGQATHPERTISSPRPTPSPTPDPLVRDALGLKPLEDIESGDRVIYQGKVCTWQKWDGNINTSMIKCPGEKAFEIETGRLTPVERKSKGTEVSAARC